MKPAAKFAIVLVTAPDLKTARALAKAALSARLIACANLVPKIESHYRWQGKIESERGSPADFENAEIQAGRAGKTGSRQTSLRHAGISGFAGERRQ